MDRATHPGHRALRAGRASVPGQVYLVTTVVRKREPLFARMVLATSACRALHASLQRLPLESLCWMLMPDHLHLLLRLREGDLSRSMGYLKARIAAAVNSERRSELPVWDRGFHDHALRRNEDLQKVARYIVANPVRAALVDSARMYSFWDAAWLDNDSQQF